MRLPRLLALVVVLGALAAGCEVRVDVAVQAEVDGSGEVRVAVGLDDLAAAAVPDLASQLRLDDLRDSGWTVTGPAEEGDGITWIRASKPFASPEEASAVMAEVSGPDGPFRDFRLERGREAFTERIRFRGVVDLSSGLEGFADDALRGAVGSDLQSIAEQIRRDTDEQIRDVFRFRVAALLPGSISSNAPTELDGAVVWTPRLGEEAHLSATGEAVRGSRVALAAALGASLLGLAALGWRRWRRRQGVEAAADG